MRHKSIYILWDASHIWGIMAWRALRAFGLSCRLVKSKEIAQGALQGKLHPERAVALLAPGGSGRMKSQKLGERGRGAIRDWLASGGVYLGFCGGAGLALRATKEDEGLGICPWRRGEYPQRVLHLLSGHVRGACENGERLELPIWWPGRFSADDNPAVHILARIIEPSEDLWLSDLPLARMPDHVLARLRDRDVLDASLSFLEGQPLVISGKYGEGNYLLSYAHLETPLSFQANAWLASLIREFCGLEVKNDRASSWTHGANNHLNDISGQIYDDSPQIALSRAFFRMRALIELGVELGFFFRREPWLFGWRAGLGGMACNNLLAGLSILANLDSGAEVQKLWRRKGRGFCDLFSGFIKKAEAAWWEWRLDRTMGTSRPQNGLEEKNIRERAAIFGHPMLGGGMIQVLLDLVEELIWLSQDNARF